MPESVTTFTYDVSQAVSALDTLSRKSEEFGKKSEDGFNKAEDSSGGFETKLGNLGSVANELTGGLSGLAVQSLAVVAGFGAAAIAGEELLNVISEQTFGFEKT